MVRTAKTSLTTPPPALMDAACLFLDFDGTLVEIAPRPADVVIDRPLRTLILALVRRFGPRVAIVSGRPADDLCRFFADVDLTIAGSHGLELRWPDGRRSAPLRPPVLSQVVRELRVLEATFPGVLVEDKPFGVALHYRNNDRAEFACRRVAREIAERTGLGFQPGKMVFELRVSGTDKGSAVEAFMADPACRGHIPIFVGDDLTDEPGFEAAVRLGGAGVLVGAIRETAASYSIATVAQTRSWLEGVCES